MERRGAHRNDEGASGAERCLGFLCGRSDASPAVHVPPATWRGVTGCHTALRSVTRRYRASRHDSTLRETRDTWQTCGESDTNNIGTYVHLFQADLGGSACSSEIVQVISVFRHFGGHSGMIRRADCRNWLHFYRIPCRLFIIGGKRDVDDIVLVSETNCRAVLGQKGCTVQV